MSVIVPNSVNGIDISSVQYPVDFHKVKKAGFEFVYIQAGRYSSTKELRFDQFRDDALAAGLRVGAYWFCAHDSDPAAQMQFFHRACSGLGMKPGELPPMIDWEFCTPSKYKNHPQHCVNWLHAANDEVDRLWYPDNQNRILKRYGVTYTYPNYAGTHQPALAGAVALGGRPLAYASYKSEPVAGKGWKLVPWLPHEGQQPLHPIPKPFTGWKLWQYSGNNGLKVPGIAADCDRMLFNGSSGEFDEFCGIQRPVHRTELQVKE